MTQADRALFIPDKRLTQVGFGPHGDDQSAAYVCPVMRALISDQLEPSAGFAR